MKIKHCTHQSLLIKKLPKIREIPLGKIRKNRIQLSFRDGESAVLTSQAGKNS